MRQKSHEAAADFLVHVLGAVDGLPKTGRVSSHNMRSRPFCQRCSVRGAAPAAGLPLQPRGPPKTTAAAKAKVQAPALCPLRWLLLQRRRPSKRSRKVPCLNPDPFTHLICPKNYGEAFIDDKLTTSLLDNGAQLNFITPDYAVK